MSEVPDQDSQETLVHLDVPPGYRSGERLDVYISEKLADASRSKVQKAVKEGHVSVNDVVASRVSASVQAGDRIVVRVMRPPPVKAEPEAIPLDVIYEDDVLLVVNKPAGMVVHPAYGHRGGTLVNALLHHVGGTALAFEEEVEEADDEDVGLSTATALPRFEGDATIRPGIVHRLDKDTSGLLVVAKNDVVHARLAEQFMNRSIRRNYLAIVWGIPDPPSGSIETYLGRDPRDRKRIAVVGEERGKHALTHYEVLEPLAHLSLVRFQLATGRTHQIRVHARQMGHSVLGDATYGGETLRYGPDTANRRKFFRNLFERMPRQALHAHTLGFTHPTTGAAMDFEAPMPDDMAHVLGRLRSVEPA